MLRIVDSIYRKWSQSGGNGSTAVCILKKKAFLFSKYEFRGVSWPPIPFYNQVVIKTK
ncbi:hypothetical protein GCM10010912_03000 [Paenibacillus albidus]|uniref:Uncharacterized protein n=1 Tax=Paenibacillus albidus TaxID=2041023 RepID=A0A917BZ86_9BACL|nr:hypothetical protein GCM10010912_03000 [Paenibacillus albidus]